MPNARGVSASTHSPIRHSPFGISEGMVMRLDTSQHLKLQQTLKLAPRMIQSMEILQLPVLALQERIQQELQENPVLELRERREEPSRNGTTEEPTAEEAPKPEPTESFEEEYSEAMRQDWDDYTGEGPRRSRASLEEAGDKKLDAMQNMPSRPPSLQEHLLEQLHYIDAPEHLLPVLEYLISNLDDDGRIRPLEEVMQGYQPPVPIAEAEEALRFLQQMDPPGVGARTLEECLLLQITEDMPHRDVLRVLIQNHLRDDIANNRLPIIQKKTGYDLDTIQEAIEIIRHGGLNPKPGSAFDSSNVQYVVPDVVVEHGEDGEYTIRLVDDYVPDVYISRRWLERYQNKNTSQQERDYLRRRIQSARWLVEAIQQRRATLEKVTRAIIHHQKAFLDQGPEHIVPLKMQQIADRVGVHVTTVSRAVDDKWVQTPRGVFPLKRFFGGGTTTASGEELAYERMKQKLTEMIGHEDKTNPLSDEDLVKLMQAEGYPVARRTVTKYRKLLKIPSSRQRKQWLPPV
jgi:RNA polymerase sigma-54 factor